ncbi:MAG: sensor histidine kinase [Elusimicrobiota bacterium]
MESILNNYPPVMDVVVFNKTFRPVDALCRLSPCGGEAFFRDAAVVRSAIAEKGFYLGDSNPAPYPAVKICVPQDSMNSEAPGYLSARINLLDLSRKLQGLDLGSGGRVYVLNEEGHLLADSARSVPLTESVPMAPEIFKSDWREGEYVGPVGRALGVKAAVPHTGWVLIFEQPAAAAFRLMEQVRRRVRLTFFIAILLAAGLCLASTRFLIRALGEFRRAVRTMREGRFDAVITARSTDEIGAFAQELREAQGAIERRTRQATIGLMAQRLGHDLRQLLMAVRDSLEVIRRHAPGADAVALRHFDLIMEEVDRGNGSVEEILTFGRDTPVKRRSHDMTVLARKAVEEVRFPKEVEVMFSMPESLPSCRADGTQVHRALVNLLRNALEALPGRGRILVSAFETEGRVILRVADDGPGIPPELQEKIFEEFFTTKPRGTGLGMGIVKKIMDLHGGAVKVRSSPGEGTTVDLEFMSEHS